MSEHNTHPPPPRAPGERGPEQALAAVPASGAPGSGAPVSGAPGSGEAARAEAGKAEAARREAPASQDEGGPSLTERLPRPPQVIRIGGRTIIMPTSRWVRIGLGGTLVLFGVFGFLPILGFWMIPLGLLILSIDVAIVRRWRRRSAVWFQRRFPGLSATLRRWTTPSHLRGEEDRR